METGTIIISTILIVICILPFILISRSTRKKEKQLKKLLESSVSKNNGKLTDYVINNNFALGLDSNAKQIYYYKKTQETEYFQKVNLNEIKSCEVKKNTKRIKEGKSNYELIQRVSLMFTNAEGTIVEQFELYDDDGNSQLNGEIALADNWKQKVGDLLSQNNTILEANKISQSKLDFA